jgi:tetratricopeptide (TPR) repeat protein
MVPRTSGNKTLAKDMGVQAILTKPFDLIEIDNILRKNFPKLSVPKTLEKSEQTRVGFKRPTKEDWRNTNLIRMPFPKVLANIYKEEATGILTVESAKQTIKIKFYKGHPSAFVSSALAKFLIRQGHLPENQAKEIPVISKKKKVNSKQALQLLGNFDESMVDSMYRAFVYDLSAQISDMRKANAFFADKKLKGQPVANTIEMVWQGVRRLYSQDRLTKLFKKGDRISKPLYPAKPTSATKKLPKQIRTILKELGEGSSIQAMQNADTKVSKTDLLQAIYALILCNVCTFNAEDKVKPEVAKKKAAAPEPAKTEKPEPPKKPEPVEKPVEPPKPPPPPPPEPTPAPTEDAPPVQSAAGEPAPKAKKKEKAKEKASPKEVKPLSNKEVYQAAARFMESGSYSKAQAFYEDLLDRGVEKPEVLVNLSLALYHNRFRYHSQDRLLDVAWAIKRALALDDKFIPAYITFGKILEKDDKPDLAEDQYRLALAIEPKNPKAQAALKRLTH